MWLRLYLPKVWCDKMKMMLRSAKWKKKKKHTKAAAFFLNRSAWAPLTSFRTAKRVLKKGIHERRFIMVESRYFLNTPSWSPLALHVLVNDWHGAWIFPELVCAVTVRRWRNRLFALSPQLTKLATSWLSIVNLTRSLFPVKSNGKRREAKASCLKKGPSLQLLRWLICGLHCHHYPPWEGHPAHKTIH